MELKAYMRILIRKWWIVLPTLGVTIIATVIFTVTQKPVYESKATYVAKLNTSFQKQEDLASALDILSRRAEIASTYAEVINSRRIKNLAADELGLSSGERSSLSVNSHVVAGTNILEISVRGNDPGLVRDFTNAVGVNTVAYIHDLYETYELASLDDASTPKSPIRPKRMFNYMLGAILGTILGVGLAFLIEYLQPASVDAVSTTPISVNGANAQQEEIFLLKQKLTFLQAQLDATQDHFEQVQAILGNGNHLAKAVNSNDQALEERPADRQVKPAGTAQRKNGATPTAERPAKTRMRRSTRLKK